jgi:hypothetical protein
MGFDFNTRRHLSDWEDVRLAMHTYKNLYGNFLTPFSFVVPHGDMQWPQQTWGIKLGVVVSGIRTRGLHSMHHDELRAMGFDLNKMRNRQCFRKPKMT